MIDEEKRLLKKAVEATRVPAMHTGRQPKRLTRPLATGPVLRYTPQSKEPTQATCVCEALKCSSRSTNR